MHGETLDATSPPIRKILEAACDVFAEHGFDGARVDAIARRAGVNKAMLYYHVGDKAALYHAVLRDHVTRMRATVESAVSTVDAPADRLRAIIRSFFTVFAGSPRFPQIMLRELATGGANLPNEVLAIMSGVLRATREVIEDGTRRGDFRPVNPLVTHLLVVGASFVVMNAERLRGRLSELGVEVSEVPTYPDGVVQAIGDLLLTGVAARPGREGDR
jgi:TetR/AcrR family transcriptional regulator